MPPSNHHTPETCPVAARLEERVDKEAGRLDEKVDKLDERLDKKVDERLNEMNGKLDDILKALNGNGSPGLKTRLRMVEMQVTGLLWIGGAMVLTVVGRLLYLAVEKIFA